MKLNVSAAALAGTLTAAQSAVKTVHMPLHLAYGSNEKISTTVTVPGTNVSIAAVYDSGSENFFLFGPNSVVAWGSNALAVEGPCHVPVPASALYDYTKSPTASSPAEHNATYVYGGADKIYEGAVTVNDTFVFGGATTVADVRVELTFKLIMRVFDTSNCTWRPLYDTSILGVSPFFNNASTRVTVGPSFRQDLLENKAIDAPVQCLWFDAAPADVYGTYTGGGLLGGIDTSKYTGPLVKVENPAADGAFAGIGYFTAVPTVSVNGQNFSKPADFTQCQLDSGTHDDGIPVAYEESGAFYNATGLVLSPAGYISWPGTCDSIPADRTVDLTFPGAVAGESITIEVPLRAYVREAYGHETGYCTMAVTTADCLLGAPFFTAAFFAADDERGEIALAKGGVAASGVGVNQTAVVARIP